MAIYINISEPGALLDFKYLRVSHFLAVDRGTLIIQVYTAASS